jgi:uncharacterized protein (DUF1015 family)
MATVVPFRAWRYDTAQVGSLDSVAAPPYDVINPALQARLYERSQHNVVRVDLGISTSKDTPQDNRYTRAASLLRQWKHEGILIRDPEPTMTVVEEDFVGPDGQARTRRGFLAALKLSEFSENIVFPHEATLATPKRDRFELMWTTEMALSPLFLLYKLPGESLMNAWDDLPESKDAPTHELTAINGTRIKLWPTSDPTFVETIRERMEPAQLLIGDGHHRYETALFYKNTLYAQGDGPGAWDYCMVYLVDMEDPGLAIFGTHRLVRDFPQIYIDTLPRALERDFFVRRLTTDPAAAPSAIGEYLQRHEEKGGAFGLYVSELGTSYGVVIKNRGSLETDTCEDADGHSIAYKNLDVSILHHQILQQVLGVSLQDVAAGRHVSFFKEWDESFEQLNSGVYQAGFFMNPTRMSQVKKVAMDCGERMPQKATYFYPKLPSGLVFYDLRAEEPPSDAV